MSNQVFPYLLQIFLPLWGEKKKKPPPTNDTSTPFQTLYKRKKKRKKEKKNTIKYVVEARKAGVIGYY